MAEAEVEQLQQLSEAGCSAMEVEAALQLEAALGLSAQRAAVASLLPPEVGKQPGPQVEAVGLKEECHLG